MGLWMVLQHLSNVCARVNCQGLTKNAAVPCGVVQALPEAVSVSGWDGEHSGEEAVW